MDFFKEIPEQLINFIIITAFSLLIGLEQRVHHPARDKKYLFGTDRTFTLIGIMGFILYILSPDDWWLYIAGGLGLLVLLSISYIEKIKLSGDFGLTTIFIALLTYTLAPLIFTQNIVLVLLIFVSIIILTGVKKNLTLFAKKFNSQEFLTLAKFIILSGVVLPLLPKESLLPDYDISLYKIWLAVIAVSGISYLSYILKKFVFTRSGLIFTALLGGLYSSTATTLILARKSDQYSNPYEVSSGIMAATAMMYVRLLILAWIFNKKVAEVLLPAFLILAFISGSIAFYFYHKRKPLSNKLMLDKTEKNPLEFHTALLFGFLFAFFSILTHYIFVNYGQLGINLLSVLVGITDIDPFVLNLFQNGLNELTLEQVYTAVLLASISNNFLKAIYAIFFGNHQIRKHIISGFALIIFSGILLLFLKF